MIKTDEKNHIIMVGSLSGAQISKLFQGTEDEAKELFGKLASGKVPNEVWLLKIIGHLDAK